MRAQRQQHFLSRQRKESETQLNVYEGKKITNVNGSHLLFLKGGWEGRKGGERGLSFQWLENGPDLG